MASIRMSDSLRRNILNNFKKQIKAVYSDNTGLDEHVQGIVAKMHSPEAIDLIDRSIQLDKDYAIYQDPLDPVAEFNSNYFVTVHSIGFIMNPNRPDKDNCTMLTGVLDKSHHSNEFVWHKPYISSYNSNNTTETTSEFYLEGDVAFNIKLQTSVVFDRFQRPDVNKAWDSPSGQDIYKYQNPIIISKTDDIAALTSYAEGTLKLTESITTMEALLQECTTLKRFLDAWPAGLECVPQDVVNKMHATTVKPKSGPIKPAFNAATFLPDEVKEEMNSAVLTSKLLS